MVVLAVAPIEAAAAAMKMSAAVASSATKYIAATEARKGSTGAKAMLRLEQPWQSQTRKESKETATKEEWEGDRRRV